MWTAADSDGDGVMEYTEYFSATLSGGLDKHIYQDLMMFLDVWIQVQKTIILLQLLMMVPVHLQRDDNEYVVTLMVEPGIRSNFWNIVDGAGAVVLSGGAPITVDDMVTACLNNDGTNGYYLNMNDSFGDGWNGNVFTLWTAADSDGDGVMEYTEYFSATLESGSVWTSIPAATWTW